MRWMTFVISVSILWVSVALASDVTNLAFNSDPSTQSGFEPPPSIDYLKLSCDPNPEESARILRSELLRKSVNPGGREIPRDPSKGQNEYVTPRTPSGMEISKSKDRAAYFESQLEGKDSGSWTLALIQLKENPSYEMIVSLLPTGVRKVCIGTHKVPVGIYHVNATGTGDFATIQAAINAVPAGSEIVLADGTYTGPGNWDLDFLGKDVVLRSASGDSTLCIVQCGGTHYGALFDDGETNQCRVSGIGFINGSEGLILGHQGTGGLGSPTIANCRIADCATGIVVQGMGSHPLITQCLVENNGVGLEYDAGTNGGRIESTSILSNTSHGVFVHGFWTLNSDFSYYFMRDCEIAENMGAGVHSTSTFAHISMRDCRIHNNGEWGVKIYSTNDFGLRIVNSSVYQNNLGGLSGNASFFTLVSLCDIYDNTGPGIEASSNIQLRIGESTIHGNTGDGIVYGYGSRKDPSDRDPYEHFIISDSRIMNNGARGIDLHGAFHHLGRVSGCLISGNTAEGVLIDGANNYRALVEMGNNTIVGNGIGATISTDFPVTLSNTIIANNTGVSVQCDNTDSLTIDCSNLFGNGGGDEPTCIPDFFSTTNNISADPLFCDPLNGDYTLYSNSPCAQENNPDCGQIGVFGVGCEGLDLTCYDLQAYDPITGTTVSPYINIPVTVEGVVFSAPQTYNECGGGYLQDDTGGINFHREDNVEPIHEGDLIRISGSLWPDGGGEVYAGNFTFTILETGLMPVPTEYTVTELLSDYHHIGSFVKVGGRVVNATPESFWLTDETSQIEVFRTDYTGVSFLGIADGSHWEVQSPCFNVLGEMKLSPRRQSDLNLNPLAGFDQTEIPLAYRLLSCSPNPFNPLTTIRYDLPRDSRVHLAIYDLTGRLVRELRSGEMESAGRQEVVWRGQDKSGRYMAAGVYMYRLKAGEFTASRQMVLVK